MMHLPRDFTRFWRDLRPTDREWQRVVRLLIEDVTVQKADHILTQIRFKGEPPVCSPCPCHPRSRSHG
jgi:hypothetical protein